MSNQNFMNAREPELIEETKEQRVHQSGELSHSLVDENCMSSRVLAFQTVE